MNSLYTPEYRASRCLQCGKLLSDHRLYAQADIDAVRNATCQHPINGHYSPLSPTVIGKFWINGHAPMKWTN